MHPAQRADAPRQVAGASHPTFLSRRCRITVKDMKGIRRLLVITGMILLVPALLWLVAGLAGLVPTDAVAMAGTSGLRIIGSVAVAGCLLAAIGSWDD